MPPSLTQADIAALVAGDKPFRVVAQPLVDLSRGAVAGYELLARFEALGVGPEQVFHFAESLGLGAALDAVVVKRGVQLRDELPPNCFLTVNVDPAHLLDPLLMDATGTADLNGIVFELTEHRRIEDVAALGPRLQALRARGALIAVDDAGTGYAGLTHLLAIQPQLIKLDRELISGIDQDPRKRSLVQMLGEFGADMDAWLLGEGIETAGELATLQELRVPLGQGYFLARPDTPWCGINALAQVALEAAPLSERRSTLRTLLSDCPTFAGLDWPDMDDFPECVKVDEHARPVAMRLSELNGRVLGESELLKVSLATEPSALAKRLMLREPHLRWTPALCVDGAGRLLGQVQPARLMVFLAESVGRRDAPPPSSAPTLTLVR